MFNIISYFFLMNVRKNQGETVCERASFLARYFSSTKWLNKYKTETKKEQKAEEIERESNMRFSSYWGSVDDIDFRVFSLSFFFHCNRVTRESGQKHRMAEKARAPET